MKPGTLDLLLAGTFVLALAGLVAAESKLPPAPAMVKQASPPASLKDDEFLSEAKDFYFKRVRRGDHWNLTFRFMGLAREHEVSCRLNIQKSQELIDFFSYRNVDKAKALAEEVQEQARQATLNLQSFGQPWFTGVFNEKKGQVEIGYRWYAKSDVLLPAGALESAKQDEEDFASWYGKMKDQLVQEAEAGYMTAKGFLYDPQQGWLLDYSMLVSKAAPVLEDCTRAFNDALGDHPEILMMFFQEMPFQHIDDAGTAWTAGGVRVPSSVLLQRAGDCDSKAVAFCVLQRSYPRHLVLFRSFRLKKDKTPSHVLLGVEKDPPQAKEKWIEARPWRKWPLEATFYRDPLGIDNRDYVPCEVAGPGRTLYGEVAKREWEKQVGGRWQKIIVTKEDYSVIPIPPLDKYILPKSTKKHTR